MSHGHWHGGAAKLICETELRNAILHCPSSELLVSGVRTIGTDGSVN